MKKETTKTKKGMSDGKKMAVAGVVTAGVAAIGSAAYMFLGPDGKKNQKKAKALIGKMEKEVKSKIKMAKDMSEPMYKKAVDAMAKTYSQQYKEHAPEIKMVAEKLKSEWKSAAKKMPKVVVTKAGKTNKK